MLNLSQPFAHIVVYFTLDGEKYEVEHSNIKFMQDYDFKGQPQNEVYGGQLSLTLSHMPDDSLYLWAKKSTLVKNAQLVYQTDMGITLLSVDLLNAYCMSLIQEFSSYSGTKTTLVISPESVVMNGITHNNIWKKN
jgi:hypothetical protein